MPRKILITGGSGLVGNALRRTAPEQCVYISSADYDLRSFQQTKEMFEHHKPTHVFHLAACVGGLFKNMNNKVQMLEENLNINYNVVKCCHDFKITKLVACLSTCIFPDKTEYPINETMLHDGPPHNSNDAYAYAKRMLHIHCKAYRENFGDNFVCVIPTNIYGPNDNYDLQNGHVIPSLINQCYIAARTNTDFIVKGTGQPLRQFLYADDLATILWRILDKYDGETIIIAPDEEVSIARIAELIAKQCGYENRIRYDTNFSDGQYKKTASNKLLVETFGPIDFTPLDEGIAKSVQWFAKN